MISSVQSVCQGKYGAFFAIYCGKKVVFKPSGSSNIFDSKGMPLESHYRHEIAAYILDSKILNFGIVPETQEIVYEDKPASIQRFVCGMLGREIVKNLFKCSTTNPPIGVDLFQTFVDQGEIRKLIIFDMIINNTDRHIMNCLFDLDEDRVWAIDNACAFKSCYRWYYNVFHRFLYEKSFVLKLKERKLLESISREKLKKYLSSYLTEDEIEHTYLRVRWMLSQDDLSFSLMSGDQEDRRRYPSRSKWFKKNMYLDV